MDTTSPKSNIVDSIKKSTNILVTVSHDPSVDALSAAIGLSLMLNKLDKHATAVFSGIVPHAMEFLEPSKRFEDSVSSLRDFIIALDKDKADRLRYKVEGNLVRIYITPYKTTITQKDLDFSEGDFNVDLVIALGVEQQDQLDGAITAHGKILHDATVATINSNANKTQLGTINWSDDKASSLCEMLMSLSEALQANILDEQISTALLTGIVAATNRFSNEHTTPRVMTMSAQLMAAGANQQLIAEKLEETHEIETPEAPQPRDGSTRLEEGESKAVVSSHDEPAQPPVPIVPPEAASPTGEIHVHHDGTLVEQATKDAEQMAEVASDERREEANASLEEALHDNLPSDIFQQRSPNQALSTSSSDWRDNPMPATDEKEDEQDSELPPVEMQLPSADEETMPPMPPLGSDVGASTPVIVEPAPEPSVPPSIQDSRTESEIAVSESHVDHADHHDENEDVSSRGKTLDPVTMQPIKSSTPLPKLPPLPPEQSAPVAPPVFNPIPSSASTGNDIGLTFEEVPLPDPQSSPTSQTIDDLKAEVVAAASSSPATNSIDDARSAVNNAFGNQPLSVGGEPAAVQPVSASADGLMPPPPPPMPDFSAMPPMPPAAPAMPEPTAPHPAAPTAPATPAVPPAAPAANQFRIPGQ